MLKRIGHALLKRSGHVRDLTSERDRLATECRRLGDERDRLASENERLTAEVGQFAGPEAAPLFVVPGHYCSPIPSLDDLQRYLRRRPPASEGRVAAVDLNEEGQLALLAQLQPFYDEQPFPEHEQAPRRYYFENGFYSYCDALFLYAMIRHLRPRRLIEIGSGFSSCVALDTNELYFDNTIAMTFIEPYPDRLRSLVNAGDLDRATLVQRDLQEVDLGIFGALEANDILFVDSSHVAKVGSDVNRVFFEVLPVLQPGVHVHFHDVFYPFEYPKAWLEENRAWNEDYLLRAFLQYNDAFEIVLFSTFLERFHNPYLERHMPLCLRNPGGSIWLRKRRQETKAPRRRAGGE